ncbi:MAG: AI-2E family transporter [Candidatus Magasanikbacteria bacterium]|nr:AI-2E family transporter [Candidatus Magasanikbacteria bacterium]
MPNSTVSITTDTIARVFFVALAFYFAYLIRGSLLLIFISFIIATIIQPWAVRGEKLKIPRAISVALVYLVALVLFAGIGWVLIPLFVREISQIAINFSGYWDKAAILLPANIADTLKVAAQNNLNAIADAAKTGLTITVSGIFSTVQRFVSIAGSFVIVIVLAYYFVVEEKALRRGFLRVLPVRFVSVTQRLLQNAQYWLGGWARGQIALSAIIGVCVYISLLIIGVPFAFALAVLAALFEFIPYAGPIFSGFFGVFFALTVSPGVALFTAIAYYIIQFLENNLLVPKVMQKAAGVNPVLSFVMIMVSYEVLGIVGVFLGVPIAALIMAILESVSPDIEKKLEV